MDVECQNNNVCKACGCHVDCPACNMYICPQCGTDLVKGIPPVELVMPPAMDRLRALRGMLSCS